MKHGMGGGVVKQLFLERFIWFDNETWNPHFSSHLQPKP